MLPTTTMTPMIEAAATSAELAISTGSSSVSELMRETIGSDACYGSVTTLMLRRSSPTCLIRCRRSVLAAAAAAGVAEDWTSAAPQALPPAPPPEASGVPAAEGVGDCGSSGAPLQGHQHA